MALALLVRAREAIAAAVPRDDAEYRPPRALERNGAPPKHLVARPVDERYLTVSAGHPSTVEQLDAWLEDRPPADGGDLEGFLSELQDAVVSISAEEVDRVGEVGGDGARVGQVPSLEVLVAGLEGSDPRISYLDGHGDVEHRTRTTVDALGAGAFYAHLHPLTDLPRSPSLATARMTAYAVQADAADAEAFDAEVPPRMYEVGPQGVRALGSGAFDALAEARETLRRRVRSALEDAAATGEPP